MVSCVASALLPPSVQMAPRPRQRGSRTSLRSRFLYVPTLRQTCGDRRVVYHRPKRICQECSRAWPDARARRRPGEMFRGLNSKNFKVSKTGRLDIPAALRPLMEPDEMVIIASPCHGYEPVKCRRMKRAPSIAWSAAIHSRFRGYMGAPREGVPIDYQVTSPLLSSASTRVRRVPASYSCCPAWPSSMFWPTMASGLRQPSPVRPGTCLPRAGN